MDRRDSIKSMLIGGLAGGIILTGCDTNPDAIEELSQDAEINAYGRTEPEKQRDAQLHQESFLTEQELGTIAILCDLILPATDTAGSATEAGVPDFIDFIVKDISAHQVPIRGGLMWLDNRAMKLYTKLFVQCSHAEQTHLLDEIAYPDVAAPEVAQGVQFFTRMRNLVLTGYYTSKTGIEELGYKGNVPNVWDGVPESVLQKHGLAYDKDWLAKCVDQEKRNVLAEWDAEGNLIS